MNQAQFSIDITSEDSRFPRQNGVCVMIMGHNQVSRVSSDPIAPGEEENSDKIGVYPTSV